jgi:PAP2 superfamily
MNLRTVCLIATVAVLAASPFAKADNAVLYWNNQALDATRLSRNPPPIAALHLATFQACLFEAVNGITPTYASWAHVPAAPAGASIDAAVAGAAHRALLTLWRDEANPRNIELAYEEALAKIPAGKAREDGLAYGETVAMKVLALREKASMNTPPAEPYAGNEQGRWRETPPYFRPAVAPEAATTTPFVMTSPSQFRAPPPFPLGSKEYAETLANTAKLGSRDHAQRTIEQALTSPFWADDLGSATPAGHWNVIAHGIALQRNLDNLETARLLALLNFATADAGIAAWDSKFYYRLWRPETALRELDPKINPYVKNDPGFIPTMEAPAHPEYVCAHCTFSASASRMLMHYFGTDDIAFTTTSDGLPGVIRSFKKLSDAQHEVGMSRIYGGIHTMMAVDAGTQEGNEVADYVFANALLPLKK